jgi:hypothetical protein
VEEESDSREHGKNEQQDIPTTKLFQLAIFLR